MTLLIVDNKSEISEVTDIFYSVPVAVSMCVCIDLILCYVLYVHC